MAVFSNLSLHIFTISFFLILATLATSDGSDNEYERCSTLISCGKLHNVGYPFWGLGRPPYCGHPALQLHCSDKSNEYPFLMFGDQGVRYYVQSIHNSSSSLKTTIQLLELSDTTNDNKSCPFHNFDKYFEELFQFSETIVKSNLFYNCPKEYTANGSYQSITCRYNYTNITAYYLPRADNNQFKYCKFLTVPVFTEGLNHLNQGEETLLDMLKQGYEVDYLYSSSRLHHNNLVKLYGCTTRHSRELLLVYEFIPNGTVADHLHGDRKESGTLSWDTRMKIATETASALSYLHASDIIHRDVKTNNILLDNHFSVKVADFGLSRLFPSDTTHVSTAPQGTPGYLDPGYNKCYQVTNKSDVYSFGVVLAELISSLPRICCRVSFLTEVCSDSTIGW